jgi:hypothetical protein
VTWSRGPATHTRPRPDEMKWHPTPPTRSWSAADLPPARPPRPRPVAALTVAAIEGATGMTLRPSMVIRYAAARDRSGRYAVRIEDAAHGYVLADWTVIEPTRRAS